MFISLIGIAFYEGLLIDFENKRLKIYMNVLGWKVVTLAKDGKNYYCLFER